MSTDQASATFVEQLPPAIRDRFEALDFVQRQLPDEPNLRRYYDDFRQWLRESIKSGVELPAEPDLPPWSAGESPAQKSYRYLAYLIRQLHEHGEEGRRPLAWVHARMNEVRQQLAGLRRKILAEGRQVPEGPTPAQATGDIPVEAIPVAEPRRQQPFRSQPPKAPEPAGPRRSVLEILTDPHSIQWFLAAGAGLFVVGLVLLLWSLDIFRQYPVVAAGFLGVGSLGLVFGGWAVLAATRYQMAGRALTLLGCLVLPLNLWYYHATGLLTEHLWVPALAICVVYAASAWRLRDPIFVPVLVAGVALTGLLILADVGKFAEVAAPAAFLVGLAFACVHLERAFPEADGPFGRKGFGLAFFWSGHVVLLAGLGLLAGGQILGAYVRAYGGPPELIPAVAVDALLKKLALALVLVATYLYLYSDMVVRHVRLYTVLAAVTLLWAEVLVLNVLGIDLGLEVVILTLAGTGLAVNLFQAAWGGEESVRVKSLPVLGLLLNLVAVVLAVGLHLPAVAPDRFGLLNVTWMTAGTLAVVAVSSRIGAALAAGKAAVREWLYFFAAAAATLMAVAELLVLVGVQPWAAQAAWLMLVPILYVVAARLYHPHSAETPLVWCGHFAVIAILLSCWAAAELGGTRALATPGLLALVFAEATAFYALNALWRQRAFNVYLATGFAVAALWTGLHALNVRQTEAFTLAVAGAGLALLVAYRVAWVESLQPRLTTAVFQCANGLVSLALVAGFLQVAQRLQQARYDEFGDWMAHHSVAWGDVGYLGALVGAALLAAVLVVQSGWRRWYVVAAVATTLLGAFVVYQLIDLEPWRMAELVAVGLGALILAASLAGWARETDEPTEAVGFGLAMGSLLVAVPLALAVAVTRFGATISPADELAFVTAGVLLFGLGFILKLQAPTLVGVLALAGYVVMLIVHIHRFLPHLWILGIYLAAGGLLLFGIGLVLSVYRDWLLALPERIRKREGVWRVFTWR